MEFECNKCKSICNNKYRGKSPVCSACRKYFVDNCVWNFNYRESAKGGDKFATKITRKMGASAEFRFVNICKNNNNYRIRGSTKYEETKLHYDFVVEIKRNNIKEYYRIEVKSIKSRKRGDLADPQITYIEYENIYGGPGWLYGDSDYIAFEQLDHFVIRVEPSDRSENMTSTCKHRWEKERTFKENQCYGLNSD